jgi:hypothetical protein
MLCRRLLTTFALVLLTAGVANADLDVYLRSLSVSAEADLGGFRTQVGAHFGASGPQLDLAFRSVDRPADVAVCLWLAQQSRQPVEVVLREYRSHKGQGWGALAQSLGIKPGSAAFKALKQGELGWKPAGAADGNGKNKSKGNGKKGHS